MTDGTFQDQLDEALSQPPKDGAPRSFIGAAFSIRRAFFAFLKGLVLIACVLGGLSLWAWLQTEKTMKDMMDRLPSKTAIIQTDAQNIYRMADAQPVLKMDSLKAEETQVGVSSSAQALPEKVEIDDVSSSAAVQTDIMTGGALVAAPVPGLYESTGEGILPLPRVKDGLTPFEAYKKPFVYGDSTKPTIAIVITDMGISSKVTSSVINNFPPEISLVFSPYSHDLRTYTDEARAKGHEAWLTLPLETKDYPQDDPGPLTLLRNASTQKNQSRLVGLLSSTVGYAGFVTQKDHVFTSEDSSVNPAIQQIFSRGLAIIDTETTGAPHFAQKLAMANDYPIVKNQIWLDEYPSASVIRQNLESALEFASVGGKAVVMLRPHPVSLKEVQKFLKSPAASNFRLAPVSALVKYGQ